MFPRAHRTEGSAIAKREERKRLGRERLVAAMEQNAKQAAKPIMEQLKAGNELCDLKAIVRRAMAMIAANVGAPAMIEFVERDCLAAWQKAKELHQ